MIESIPLVLTGIGLTASIVYYASILRNANKTQQQALETRQAAMFMNIYNQWTSGIHRHWGIISSWEWDDYDEYTQKYGDTESQEMVQSVGGYYEGIGVLVKEGLVPIRLVALFSTTVIIRFHEKFRGIAEKERVLFNSPRIGIETESLYNELMTYHKEHPELLNP